MKPFPHGEHSQCVRHAAQPAMWGRMKLVGIDYHVAVSTVDALHMSSYHCSIPSSRLADGLCAGAWAFQLLWSSS